MTDLRSTNGTVLIAAGGSVQRLKPGESVVALAGWAVDIGDGNIIEIMAVPLDDARRATATVRRPA